MNQTCYFDKTGTLTSDKLILLGVATCENPEEGVVHPDHMIPLEATSVMATCQELVWVNGKVEFAGWILCSYWETRWN